RGECLEGARGAERLRRAAANGRRGRIGEAVAREQGGVEGLERLLELRGGGVVVAVLGLERLGPVEGGGRARRREPAAQPGEEGTLLVLRVARAAGVQEPQRRLERGPIRPVAPQARSAGAHHREALPDPTVALGEEAEGIGEG